MSLKGKKFHRPKTIMCCAALANKLGVDQNNCFEEGPTSGGESGTGMRIVFRYNSVTNRGMCRLDLRCFLSNWDDNQCDFLFYRCSNQQMYFVELKKTQKWDHAYHQITNTIRYFEGLEDSDFEKGNITGIIVGDNTPPNAKLILRDLEFSFRKAGYKSFEKYNNGAQIPLN